MRNRCIVFGLLWTLLLSIGLSGCSSNALHNQSPFSALSQMIEGNKLDSITLKIYYVDPSVLLYRPPTPDELTEASDIVQTIIISSEELCAHIDLLKHFCAADVIPVDSESRELCRLYYFFETEDGKKLVAVSAGYNDNVFVNGIEAKYDDLFFEVLKPFLSEEAQDDIQCTVSGKIKLTDIG